VTERESDRVVALEQLRDEITRAISAQLSATRARARPRMRWVAPMIGAAIMLAAATVALVLGSGTLQPSAAQELERVARVASRRVSPPPLQPGEYWYTRSISTTPLPEALPHRHLSIELMQRVVTETWTARTGQGRVREVPLGRPTFLNMRDRQRWLAAGSPVMESYVGADNRTLRGGSVFPAGLSLFSYAQLQQLPADPKALLARLRDSFNTAERKRAPRLGRLTPQEESVGEFNTIEGLLLSPAPARVRAALYRAAARIPGVRYIGTTTDPLGRNGAAIELDTPGQSGGGGPQHGRVIYDPNTSALFAQLTDFGGPPHPGVYESESFVASGVVHSIRTIPTGLKPVGSATPLSKRLHPL
jgi:hypothetical protein